MDSTLAVVHTWTHTFKHRFSCTWILSDASTGYTGEER